MKITSKQIAQLDKLFSEFIRKKAMLNGGCERCHTPKKDYKQLQCSHFHGRRKRSVRFDPDNAVGLCGACHLYFGANPTEHVKFFLERLGQKDFDYLQARANTTQKIDEKAIAIYFREKLKELNCANIL